MPALDTITVRGFKSIKAIEQLKLNPINVLSGGQRLGQVKLHRTVFYGA